MPERADIEHVLGHYGINGRVVGERRGPLLRLHGAYVADNDIRTLLEPWRGKAVPLLPEKPAEREKQTEIPVAGKQEPGIFRRLLGWWSSLKVRERKSIISGLSRLFNGIVGRRSRK